MSFFIAKVGREENYRDVFLAGDCDAGVRSLSDGLGWREDLESRLAEVHEGLKKREMME